MDFGYSVLVFRTVDVESVWHSGSGVRSALDAVCGEGMRKRVRWSAAAAAVLGMGSAFAAFVLPTTLTVDQFGTSYIGESAGVQVGTSIATIRDLNGDAFGDLVIGAPAMPSDTRAGRVYIFFGKSGISPTAWNRNINLNEADVILSGEKTNDAAGTTVASLGDLNGDGTAELGIAAAGNADGGANAGKVYIVLGRKSGWTKNAALGTFADASYIGYTAERTGISLARAGTTGGVSDCCEDFLIGVDSHTESGKVGAGRAYLIFGKQSGWAKNVKLTDTSGRTVTDASIASFVGDVADQRVGKTVAGPLDLNRDGYSDLVLGAPGDTASGQNDRGQVAVILGKPSGWSKDQSFAAAANILIVGEQDGGSFGKSLASISSVDGDAYRELVVGAPDADVETSLSDAGKVYLFRGYKGVVNWAPGLSLTAANADASFTGEAIFDRAGSSITELGDFNQDGYDDLLIAADLADYSSGSSDNAGKAYVVFGRSSIAGATSLRDAPLKLLGTALSGRAGQAIAGRLDIDSDYYPDLAIGVPFADPSTGINAGAIYVLRGARFADQDEDGYSPYSGDCDDFDPERSPGQTDIPYDSLDQDCSGADLIDVDGDGYSAGVVGGTDCDDNSSAVNPSALETCNGKDENCNGQVDEGAQKTFYLDRDGDGYGSPTSTVNACTQPTGTSLNFADCNDDPNAGGALIYPGALETPYDGIDQDCSGGDLIDVDGDGDAAIIAGGPDCDDGNPDFNSQATDWPYNGIDENCDGFDEVDVDADGYAWDGSPGGDDCNDDNSSIHPGVTEIPYNGIDEDCSGADLTDADGDGFESPLVGGLDCDDADATSYPGARDIPNDNRDQNCDGIAAVDIDLDGYSVPDDADCNDLDDQVYPGAEELPYDGVDQDCNGEDIVDLDGDGVPGILGGGTDCEDQDNTIYPGAIDPPYDGVDQDCDGIQVNDVDGDGFDGVPAGGTDCNDQDANISPDADEIPGNTVDENCNGVNGDEDLDGYGTSPDDFGLDEDCDDQDDQVHPGAEEIPYDELDQDCDLLDLTDVDADGYEGIAVGGSDCNDNDAAVNPLAEEIRGNSVDDNCDGLVDEQDVDADGYTAESGDCNDEDPQVHPGMLEQVGDEVDNDCNGRIDEHVTMGVQVSEGVGCRVVEGAVNPRGSGVSLGLLATALGLLIVRIRRRADGQIERVHVW